MGQSNHQVSNDPLDRLVARASNQLEKLGYSRRSLRRYRTIWRRLVAFDRQMDLGGEYSEAFGALPLATRASRRPIRKSC